MSSKIIVMDNPERQEFEEELSDVTEITTDILNSELERLGFDPETEESQRIVMDAVSTIIRPIAAEIYKEVKEG